jgi:protein SCO1/2
MVDSLKIPLRYSLYAYLLALLVCSPLTHASTPVNIGVTEKENVFNNDDALAISQAAIGNTLGEYSFKDNNGRPVRLSDFKGKPVIISLIYTSCYHICPMTTRQLASAVQKARDALGDDSFIVLTIGFDAAIDTPQAMSVFARKQGIHDTRYWHFLSSDQATIERLSKQLGFIYKRSPKGFDHLIQASVIDGNGMVTVQVYGDLINTPALVEPLKQMVFGVEPDDSIFSGLLKKVKLFCTTYDPRNDRYHFDYSLFIGMFVGGTIIITGFTLLIREMRRSRKV